MSDIYYGMIQIGLAVAISGIGLWWIINRRRIIKLEQKSVDFNFNDGREHGLFVTPPSVEGKSLIAYGPADIIIADPWGDIEMKVIPGTRQPEVPFNPVIFQVDTKL